MLKRLAVASLAVLLLPLHAAALENDDLLALVAMPLAVAAVSEMTDVPVSQLVDVVTLLNDAAVPPVQFVEVVRYAPVALVVEDDQPDFVEFIRRQEQDGLRGTQLVTVIEERIRTFGVPDVELDVTAPRVVAFDDEDDFVPQVVRTRVAEVKAHPHGGPPGQLKKERGLQTGAEVVHGTKPARTVKARVAKDRDRGDDRRRDDDRQRVVVKQRGRGSDHKVAKSHGRKHGNDDHGGNHGGHHGGGKDHGHGGGHGNGKGKGKG